MVLNGKFVNVVNNSETTKRIGLIHQPQLVSTRPVAALGISGL
jgi:hypothetical protein